MSEEYQHQILGYECPIKNVTGNANIKLQNKNLAWSGWAEDFVNRVNGYNLARVTQYDNKNCLLFNASAGYGSYDTKYMFKIPFKENTAYTFYFKFFKTQTNLNMCCEYTDGTTSTIGDNTTNSWKEKIFTSSPDKTIKYIRALYYSGDTYIDLDTFMVLEGSYTAETLPEYIAHQEQHYPFTFAEGQFLATGEKLDEKINKNWTQVKLKDLTWIYETTNQYFYTYLVNLKDTTVNQLFSGFCTHYQKTTAVNNIGWASKPTNVIGTRPTTKYLCIKDTRFSNVQDFKNANSETVIQYELAEPTTIPYNSTQQEQYNAIKKARSYDDQTNISSTSDELGLNMDVESLGNINKVINNLLNN